MSRSNSLAYVLSGGEGTRLHPLTKNRTKPAVPFGGSYRVIDFVLSNLHHSGIRRIYVLTQYEHTSLHEHINSGWKPRFGLGGDGVLEIMPPVLKRLDDGSLSIGYRGTAGAIANNSNIIENWTPEFVDIFSGDHVYLMDVSKMNDYHLDKKADLTISTIKVRKEVAAKNFGIVAVDKNLKVVGFEEKPENPTPLPGDEDFCLASMGNYTFNPKTLLEELEMDSAKEYSEDRSKIAQNPSRFSSYDFGFDVIPAMLRKGRKIFAYDFTEELVPGAVDDERGFWRDIGNLDQFYDANMEMRQVTPPLNLYNSKWPVLTYVLSPQPAKFVGAEKDYPGVALESIVANGSIVSHSNVQRSVLSYNCHVEGAQIYDSILLGDNVVQPGSLIRRAILDKNVIVPKGETIGVDLEKDLSRGFTISQGGIIVVPRGYKFS